MVEEVGWLIEREEPNLMWLGKNPVTVFGAGSYPVWTSDANSAIRFAREEDARAAYELLFRNDAESRGSVRFTEHVWVDGKRVHPFAAIARDLVRVPGVGWRDDGLDHVEAFLHARFGPLFAALEKARHALGSTDTAVHDTCIDEIDDALSALRRSAREARRG